MARTYLKRQKQAGPEPAAQRSVRQQLAWAAGSEYFQHRDPVWHVTEAFQTSFDRTGRRRTEELENGSEAPGEQARRERPEPAGSEGRSVQSEQSPLRRFSETAFQRGTLAGAVMQGTGRMMLTSCLKRTAGQSDRTIQQRTISGLGAKTKRIPGAGASQVMFHRGFVSSAVGLVVDVLQDARRTVDLMTRMVQGKGGIRENEGMDTLRRMYPFLDQSREEQLLEQYRQQLQETGDVQKKALLQSAIVRTEALMDKKAQMKVEFTRQLREISDRANEALLEFQEPDFVDSLMQDLTEEDANASDSQPTDGGPEIGAGPPDGGTQEEPPGQSADTGAGFAGSSGGDEAGQAPAGDTPADSW